METVEIEGKQYPITGHDHMGIPIVQGHATTVRHTDTDGNPVLDEAGNPKVSLHVSVAPVGEPVEPAEPTNPIEENK